MLVAVLKAIGKDGAHERYPKFWERVKMDFDATLYDLVTIKAPALLIRPEFVYGIRHALQPFVAYSVVQGVEAAIAQEATPPAELLSHILTTQVGRLLYKEEGATQRYQTFLASINEKLQGLEEHSFLLSEYKAFLSVCKMNANIVMEGIQAFSTKDCKYSYMNVEMTTSIQNIEDEWHYRFYGRVTTLAASIGSLSRTPWERLLFKDKPMPGQPTTLTVPTEHVEGGLKIAQCSESCVGRVRMVDIRGHA